MNADRAQPQLILLFDSLPILDCQQWIDIIDRIEQMNTDIVFDLKVRLPNFLLAAIKFDSHLIYLTGFSVPVPKYWLELTADFAELTPAERRSIDSHKAYIICNYEGDRAPVREKLIALYKTAYGFKDIGLLGVLDRDAWALKTSNAVADIVDTKKLKFFRESTAIDLMANLVKIPKQNGDIWFCTKGFHRVNASNCAYLGDRTEDSFIRGIFCAFFDVFQGCEIAVGWGDEVMFEGGISMILGEVYECIDCLDSPLGTFVLTKIQTARKS
jgi:hypothetical protein